MVHEPVWVISLDVAIDAKLCDLSCSGGVARWLDLAIAGRVVMVLGGPPCETWSVARWNGGFRVAGAGPRAVRSSEHLWGLHGLDSGERQQVALGNALLRIVILFLAAARVYGFAAVMEHPQLPSWMPQAPSSWKLPELKMFARAGGTECVQLDQCCCGTPWKKPTRLFTVGIPELGRLVASLPGGGRCCPAPGHKHVTLTGKSEDSVCRTTVWCARSLLMRPSEALRASSVVMLVSWQLGVVSLPRSRCCMSPLITMILTRGLRGRMIAPERPRESSCLPIQLALSGTRSCTGCALPPPPPSLPLRPFVGPNVRDMITLC